jgi:hypothetical protein
MAHGGFALFGAIVHASQAHRTGKSKTLADFAILVVMSSFSGVMFSLVAIYYFPQDTYLTMAMAGTGGFLGVEGMSILVDKLRILITKKWEHQ